MTTSKPPWRPTVSCPTLPPDSASFAGQAAVSRPLACQNTPEPVAGLIPLSGTAGPAACGETGMAGSLSGRHSVGPIPLRPRPRISSSLRRSIPRRRRGRNGVRRRPNRHQQGLPKDCRQRINRSRVSGFPALDNTPGAIDTLIPSDHKYFGSPACLATGRLSMVVPIWPRNHGRYMRRARGRTPSV